jgi:DnaK suppressor protein
MTSKKQDLDQSFLRRQREALTKLRRELLRTVQDQESEESDIRTQSLGEAHESEDDAQKLAMLEVDGQIVSRQVQRLTLVERALQKIDDGTYGVSDATGEPIPRERLEAIPEAS